MKREARRAAVSAYKERKVPRGVFAVRCDVSGECWVGTSTTLDKIRNRIWFMLRQDGSPHRALQDAWNLHGSDAFSFDVVEELSEDVGEFARDRVLAERGEHWRKELGAQPI